MRKTSPLLLVLASWMLFSCTSVLETDSTIISQEEHVSEKVLTVKATIGENPETKTAVQSDGTSIFWTPGDAINLFYGTASAGQFTTAIESPALTTDFSGTLSVATGTSTESGVTTQSFWGVYPYNVSNTCTGDGVTLTIPSTQSGVAGSFADKLNPSVATSPGLSLAFYNVGSWFIFSVTQDDIVSVTLRGHNNEDLAGRVKVTMDPVSNKPVTQVLEGQKSITMTPAGGTFEVGESYYMVVIPGRMSSGLELTLTKSNGKQATWSINSDVTFTRSMYLRKLNADNGLTFEGAEPLTFTSFGSTSVYILKTGSPDDITLEYRIDDGEWVSCPIMSEIALADGESMQFRAGSLGNESFGKSFDDFYHFMIYGTGTVEASGNIMSLLDRSLLKTDVPAYGFVGLFGGCGKIVNVHNLKLPATTLAQFCYSNMFYRCGGFTTAPELPATTLERYCYSGMFNGCSGLTTAPELPATTLASSCYSGMFEGCTGLTIAPELRATTLADGCYSGMFKGCTGLTIAPELPATTLAQYCYSNMFRDCSGLTTAPELPATTLADYCYLYMFYGCADLTTAPELPALSLAKSCYERMFSQCSGLTTAPALPATTLANSCYLSMFSGCTSLSSAPDLHALSLVEKCYYQMFIACTNLSYIKMLATDISASQCLYYWVQSVAATGTFVKSPSATWDITGNSGVPSGWTVLTAVPTPEAIDLGLPSGIKWASCNLGASSPEESGDYYAWGETETYYSSLYPLTWKDGKSSGFDWSSYTLCNGTEYTMTRYCKADRPYYWGSSGSPDNMLYFSQYYYEDDAARQIMGGSWRTPTSSEWNELKWNCTWTWTDDYLGSGVSGMIVKSRVEGYTDKSIFLPAAGYWVGTNLDSSEPRGYYWCSEASAANPSAAAAFSFSSSNQSSSYYRRYEGRTIRPVFD